MKDETVEEFIQRRKREIVHDLQAACLRDGIELPGFIARFLLDDDMTNEELETLLDEWVTNMERLQ